MPVTKGQGNPDWTREETILAMDLLARNGMRQVREEAADVVELSELLRAAGIHPPERRNARFRNPASVRMKSDNLRACGTPQQQSGLRASQTDRAVWREFSGDLGRLSEEARRIRDALGALERMSSIRTVDHDDADDASEYCEGSVSMRLHRRRERARGLREKVLARVRRRLGVLSCEVCGRIECGELGAIAEAEFEAHHRRPLAESGDANRKTRVDDLAMLCASCHRLIHAAMRLQKRAVSVEEFAAVMAKRRWQHLDASSHVRRP